MEQRVVKIDLLDYLFANVGIFKQLDADGKRKIFNSRPQPIVDVVFDFVDDVKYSTPFDSKYYAEFPWMTACPKRKVLFCFVCLLQGKTVESVICARNDVLAAAQAHESTSSHLSSHDACLQSVVTHDPPPTTPHKRKSLLIKLVQTLYLLKCQAHADKFSSKSAQKPFWFETINFFALNDVHFSLDWDQHFPEIVNDPVKISGIFSTMRTLVVEHIKDELAQCNFVSMSIEDVSEYIAKPTVSVSFRFILNNRLIERFAGFYELVDYSCPIDSNTLMEILTYWDVPLKLIGISCDFDSDRLPTMVPERPFVLFNVTSPHHRLNYVIVKMAAVQAETREFLGQVDFVVGFLTDIKDIYIKNTDETTGLFVKLIPTELISNDSLVDERISLIYKHGKEISDFCSILRKHPAVGLYLFRVDQVDNLLKDPIFSFNCRFFHKLFLIGSDMSSILIGNFAGDDPVGKLGILSRLGALAEIKIPDVKIDKAICRPVNHKAILGVVLKDYDLRDKAQGNFAIGRLFCLNENRTAVRDSGNLIKSTLDSVLTETKGILDFDLNRLKTELTLVFRDPTKGLPADALFDKMVRDGTIAIYPEFVKLLAFFHTLPTSTPKQAEPTCRRIKHFAQSTRGVDSVFELDYLFVEHELTLKLLGDRDFVGYLISQFAKSQGIADLIGEHDTY